MPRNSQEYRLPDTEVMQHRAAPANIATGRPALASASSTTPGCSCSSTDCVRGWVPVEGSSGAEPTTSLEEYEDSMVGLPGTPNSLSSAANSMYSTGMFQQPKAAPKAKAVTEDAPGAEEAAEAADGAREEVEYLASADTGSKTEYETSTSGESETVPHDATNLGVLSPSSTCHAAPRGFTVIVTAGCPTQPTILTIEGVINVRTISRQR
ncbi:hypothetical protein MMC15_000888 [Xylographa vitiligo]|nr:hypothetical protein [Xylographa vitiligo]